jgi:NAD(P)-dependent dehydrogenase (short-subunit alcohol dehydrogenase family)
VKDTRFDLSGRTALITGAAGLLGGEHAAALLESGAQVVLTDIEECRLDSVRMELRKIFDKDKILVQTMDVTNPESISKAAANLRSSHVDINILLNNAAINPKVRKTNGLEASSRFEELSLDSWNQQIAVGLTGTFLCSQIFGAEMVRYNKGGIILNIASDLSVISPDQRLYRNESLPEDQQEVKPVSYSVVKTGILGLTRYIATYWAAKNIRCNALSPGGVFNGQNREFLERFSRLVPQGRMADKDEYRGAIQFLCSDASSYMNGHNLVLDGGRTIW